MCYHYSIKAEKKILERKYLASFNNENWWEREHLSGFDDQLVAPVITKVSTNVLSMKTQTSSSPVNSKYFEPALSAK